MDIETQDQVAKVLLTCGTKAQQQEALLYTSGILPKEQSLKSNWFQSAAPLEDGWYWRKDVEDCIDEDKHIVEVYNGLMYDTMPMTTYGAPLVVFENSDFQDYWFNGPIEVPE